MSSFTVPSESTELLEDTGIEGAPGAFVFGTKFARKYPDPVFPDITHHNLVVAVRDVPPGLPDDPNARPDPHDMNRRVYRQVVESLLNQGDEVVAGTFHLKNRGIELIARSVQTSDDQCVVTLESGDGIVDGGHTYRAILANHDNLPENQFVNIHVKSRIPGEWIPFIAGGLNTSVQVQQKSLDELAGKFEWIKEELRGEPYFDRIAWQENQGGPDKFDVLYLLSLLTCFNVFAFPNDEGKQPIMAYEKKTDVLKAFEQRPDEFKRLRLIVKDIIRLHDTIDRDAQTLWNEKEGGGKYGRFSFVAKKGKGKHFLDVDVDYPMLAGALFPILGALRWTVIADPITGEARWEDGFDKVVELWTDLAVELLGATQQANAELGRNPHALGRSRNHWSSLHTKVGLRYLQRKNAAETTAG